MKNSAVSRCLSSLHFVLVASAIFVAGTPLLAQTTKEIEIKFVVKEGADSHAAAWKILDPTGGMLKQLEHTDEEVCFFDTDPPSLGDLILRARSKQKIDPAKPDKIKKSADTTVKVRVDSGSTQTLSDFEKNIPAEDDWTGTEHANTSRALDWDDKKKGPTPDMFSAAVQDPANKSQELFQGPGQQQLIAAHAPALKWSKLKSYGPIHARVWKKAWHLADAFPGATIEDWTLEIPGKKPEQLLEISIKLPVQDDATAKAKTTAFFAALQAAGFPGPQSTSKTASVLKYYKTAP